MIYDKPIRQYVWYIYILQIYCTIYLQYLFANVIQICFQYELFYIANILKQYICNILSVSIKMINDNPIRQYICNTYANVLDNIFAPNILCSI